VTKWAIPAGRAHFSTLRRQNSRPVGGHFCGCTQQEAAELLHVSNKTISKWESGGWAWGIAGGIIAFGVTGTKKNLKNLIFLLTIPYYYGILKTQRKNEYGGIIHEEYQVLYLSRLRQSGGGH